MSCYKRIYYVDYLENGERQTNAGFVKLIQWKEKGETSFQIYISNRMAAAEVNCQIEVVWGADKVILGQVSIENGKGMARIEDLEKRVPALNCQESNEKVVLRVVINESCAYECVIKEGVEMKEGAENKVETKPVEHNIPVMAAEVVLESPEVGGETPESELPEILEREEPENIIAGEVPMPRKDTVKSDKWQQLWSVMPHMNPFDDEREYLQIKLQDMVVLPGAFYRLVENSFLLHGYYNYGHLIMTKIPKNGKEKVYVGVPGNYYIKEAQVAVMFGFESFEPKVEPPREGDFGYYMIGAEL